MVLQKDGGRPLDRTCEKEYTVQLRKKEYPAYLNRRQVNWIRYILRRNWFLKHVPVQGLQGSGREEKETSAVAG